MVLSGVVLQRYRYVNLVDLFNEFSQRCLGKNDELECEEFPQKAEERNLSIESVKHWAEFEAFRIALKITKS